MNMHDLLERIELLEFHQKLLLKILANPKLEFFKLIIDRGISEQEVQSFFKQCEDLCIKMEEQKAEGFVHFYPLFDQFSASLPLTLQPEEIIQACLRQKLYEPIMIEFKKYS
jgi:hypothetical protein